MSPTERERNRNRHYAQSALGCGVIALILAASALFFTLDNRSSFLDQQEGRRVGFTANCAINQAFIEAGRSALEGTGLLPGDKIVEVKGRKQFVPGPLTKQLGSAFPTYKERIANAKAAADAYELRIVEAVARETQRNGVPVSSVVNKDGHLDCALFAEQANVD